MLSERHSTLTRLTLQACEISELDSDVPLIFDLRPLAQASQIAKHLHICDSDVQVYQQCQNNWCP